MFQVGLTGGIGTGKSTISRVFKILGIPIFDADVEAKSIVSTDQDVRAKLIHHFGQKTYTAEGQINRSHLAKSAFADPAKTALINSIIHPVVRAHYLSRLAKWEQDDLPYIINEAALLFEAKREKDMGSIIVVDAPLHIRVERVLHRDLHRSKEDLEDIISRQMSQAEKVEKADFVIDNGGDVSIIKQVLDIHQVISSKTAITDQ